MNPEPQTTETTSPLARSTQSAWWRSDAFFFAVLLLLTLGLAWGMARHELESRAHHAYLEGEKYYGWYQNPAQKKAFYDGELAAGRIDPDQYQLLMSDNDLKNAYVWYDTVLELYQPPRDEWVLKSLARMKDVKPQYDAWLKSLGIQPVD